MSEPPTLSKQIWVQVVPENNSFNLHEYFKRREFVLNSENVFLLQPFNNWLDGAKEDLLDMFIVHTTEEIQVSMLDNTHNHWILSW